ncbi:hypothetical protein H7200_00920 [Candidatus Saccharibacteria bacterium]|nr:hypothetical protein [Candidatus Saccharibacteria bacterium]
MAPVSTALHVTLSDGSVLEVTRDTGTPTIVALRSSKELAKKLGHTDLSRLRIRTTTDVKKVPQFLLGELVTVLMDDRSSPEGVTFFEGRISKIQRS